MLFFSFLLLGNISKDAFLEIMREEHEKEVKASFKLFDRGGHGFITHEDFRATLREHGDTHTDDEVEEMFKKADVNNDSNISYEEFADAYHTLH